MNLKCKVFCAKHSATIEEEVNKWFPVANISKIYDTIVKTSVDRDGKVVITVMFIYMEANEKGKT